MARGTPNQALRAARAALNLGQAEFAAAVNRAARSGEELRCTARQVAKWEAGEAAWPQARYRRALEAVTGLTSEALGFTRAADGSDLLEDPVQRREFLGLGTAAALAGIPIAGLAGHGPRLSAGYLDDVHGTLQHLQGLERRFGSGPLVSLAEAQVGELSALLDDGADSPGLLEAAAWANMLAGWMNFDAGQHRRARDLYKDAHFISQLAGDRSMTARTAAAMSMHAARLGRPTEAVRLARMGQDQLPNRGRAAALLAIREARGWSLAGAQREARAAVQRAMDAHSSGPVLPWSGFFTEGELSAAAAQIAGDSGNWAEAEALASRALADDTLPPRAWASFSLYRAEVIARGGDTSGAIEATANVMPALSRLSSDRVLDRASAVLSILPADDPNVVAWREQLAATA